MGDTPNGVSYQPGAGQPSGNPPDAQGDGKGTGQYLTREEALKLLDEYRKESQGYSDRAVSGFEKRVSKRLSEIDAAASALSLTTEQKEAAKQRIIAEELARTPEPASPSPAQSAQAAQGKQTNPEAEAANRMAARLEKKHGVNLVESDPEAESLKQATSIDDWLDRYEAALEAKKQRAPAEARIPTMAGTGGASPASLTEAYKKEMLENRGKSYAVMHEIKERYRARGVDVDNTSMTR